LSTFQLCSHLLIAQSALLIAMGQIVKHVSVRNQYPISFSKFHPSGPSVYTHRTDHTFLYTAHAQVIQQSFCIKARCLLKGLYIDQNWQAWLSFTFTR